MHIAKAAHGILAWMIEHCYFNVCSFEWLKKTFYTILKGLDRLGCIVWPC